MHRRAGWIGRGVGVLAGLVLGLLLVPAGCSGRSAPSDGDARSVVVSIAPLSGLVRSVLGEDARVVVLIPPGVSPHAWEARPSDLALLRRADLVVLNGGGVERGLADIVRASEREGRTVIVLTDLAGPGAHGTHAQDDGHAHDESHAHDDGHGHDDTTAHDDGHGHEDAHAGGGGVHDHGDHGEPHLWLDFDAVRELVRRIGAWGGADADEALRRIDEIEQEYRDRLSPFRGATVITDHRAWDGLLGRFGIEVAGVLRASEHGELPPGRLAEVIEQVRRQGVRAVLVEVQFSPREGERIAKAAQVGVGRLDPIGGEDWFAMMRANLEAIEGALRGSAGAGGGPDG